LYAVGGRRDGARTRLAVRWSNFGFELAVSGSDNPLATKAK